MKLASTNITNSSHPDRCKMVKLLLDLTLKLNKSFLPAEELNSILNAVLVGITSGEGLGFNRAILFEYIKEKNILKGSLGVGPMDASEASAIWNDIETKNLSLTEIIKNTRDRLHSPENRLNSSVRSMVIPLFDSGHWLNKLIQNRLAVHIHPSKCKSCTNQSCVLEQIKSEECVIVPLYTQNDTFGMIFVDNFVTRKPISTDDVDALQLFTSLASLAICQAKMYATMDERLTQMETLNLELEKNKDLLVEAERFAAIGRMSDQLLHELRNPFSIIGGMTNFLERKNHDTNLNKFIKTILTNSRRIEKTLDDMFDFVHLPELVLEPVFLCKLVSASIDLLRSEMKRHDVAWHLNLLDRDACLMLDKNHLLQAILNVLRNSIEAMADGGMLIVAVEKQNDSFYEIRIADTGLGIAKGHITKADEPFFTTKTHSMGLGLSLAKRTFEMHDGSLEIQKNRIGGTTIILRLPANRTPEII